MNNKQCNFRTLFLPRLNLIQPTLESNLAKMTKELGKVAQCVGKYRNLNGENNTFNEKEVIYMTTLRVLDLMQTCNTMFDILESLYFIDIDRIFDEHVHKLVDRKYVTSNSIETYNELYVSNKRHEDESYRIILLPELNLLSPSIESNLIKMTEELGEVSEHVEKYIMSFSIINKYELNMLAKETLDVMQTCNTMLTSLEESYDIKVKSVLPTHVDKLVNKNYVSKEILEVIKY